MIATDGKEGFRCPSKFVVVPGRIQRWLDHPEQKTLNVSCALKVINPNNLYEDLHFVSTALRGAAGINLVINSFRHPKPIKVDWSFYLHPDHPDFNNIVWGEMGVFGINGKPVIRVADSMNSDGDDGKISIESSWSKFYDTLRTGKPVAVDLSALRPQHSTNDLGLVASGPLSFLKIYQAIARYVEEGSLTAYLKIFSTLNEVLRRGGFYKNGGISSDLNWDHSDANEYIRLPLTEVPYLKKGLQIASLVLKNRDLTELILDQVNSGNLWLEKDLGFHDGEQLYSNLCRGISLKNRGTCLLTHVNAGQIQKTEDWVQGWRDAMNFVCGVFETGAPRTAGIYRDPVEDKQVAVGICGLANFLSYHSIKYKDWVEAFERFLDGKPRQERTIIEEMVWCVACGVADAADIARSHGMRAAFAIEPTASCAYRYKDLKGYSLAPNIDPPVAMPGNGRVRRNSEAVGDQFYEHGPVEVAAEVDPDYVRRHRECWQKLFDSTGLAHMSSYELHKKWQITDLKQWFDGPLPTTYYARQTTVNHLQKGQKIMTASRFKQQCATDELYCEACED